MNGATAVTIGGRGWKRQHSEEMELRVATNVRFFTVFFLHDLRSSKDSSTMLPRCDRTWQRCLINYFRITAFTHV